jgi:integrase
MASAFTARSVASLSLPEGVRQAEYWDPSLKNFGLRISYGGQRAWVVRYRVYNGPRRRMTLGLHPHLGLADARARALTALRAAALGEDPAADEQKRRQAEEFGELATEYLERHAKPGKRSWKEDRRIIESVLLSKDGANWRRVKVRDIKRPMVRAVFEAITDRGAPVMANRVLALISKMLNFALSRDWIEANPASLITKNRETSRGRVLSDDELRELWNALSETSRVDPIGRAVARLNATLNDAFRMRIYTGQRGGEIFRMRWQDLDLDTAWWEIPGEHTKNGEFHRVPLIADAVDLLKARRAVARRGAMWVFEHVTRSKIPERQFGNIAARGKKAAAYLSRGDRHLRNKRARARKRLPVLPGLSFEFQGHDLRRTVGTNMTKAGVHRDDVSKVMNHVDRGPRATKVYDRYEYDREKRAALETWATRLEAILRAENSIPRQLAPAS